MLELRNNVSVLLAAHWLELVTWPHPQDGQEAPFLASSTGCCESIMSVKRLARSEHPVHVPSFVFQQEKWFHSDACCPSDTGWAGSRWTSGRKPGRHAPGVSWGCAITEVQVRAYLCLILSLDKTIEFHHVFWGGEGEMEPAWANRHPRPYRDAPHPHTIHATWARARAPVSSSRQPWTSRR